VDYQGQDDTNSARSEAYFDGMGGALCQKPRIQIQDREFANWPNPKQPSLQRAKADVSYLGKVVGEGLCGRAESWTYDARCAVAAQSRKHIITTKLHEGFCNRRTKVASTIQRQVLIVVVIEQEAGGI
jgi:hypothetical protein